jgi:O-antigen/teichoic acid export membrane protein
MIFFSYSLSSKNEKKFSNELLKKHNKIMGILIPIILLYGIITYFIIPIIFGINFDNAKFITLILLPGTYAITSFNILNADLSARGFPKYGLIIFTYGALSNIVLNIILIPIFDIYGSALSSTISYIFCSIIFYYKYTSITELKS